MNKELLLRHIENKLVSVQKHPTSDLYIYNYTQTVQFNRLWDEVTTMTRGLIMDKEMNIVSRPFNKFFNISEHTPEEIPNLPFEVYEKMDGSLGVFYWLGDELFIASKGSFNSDQSVHANIILSTKYGGIKDRMDKSKTYLVEIIYPENRIVCNYGDMDDLVLIAVRDTATGLDLPLEDIGLPIVKRYDGINNLSELKALEEDNKEGFVVKFSNGFRVKVKFDEYIRLHRIVTGVSNLSVWEYLSEGKPFDELLDRVPDEFYNWLHTTANDLKGKYEAIRNDVEEDFYKIVDRKAFAEAAKLNENTSLLFTRLNSYSNSLDKQIWKKIKPQFSKPFNLTKE